MGIPTYSSWHASTHSQEEHSMDPTTVFCPNRHCPARGQTGMGNIGIHSQKEQRFICHECHKTFSATKGTAFYRLRTAAETVSLVVTLLAHGCPVQAIVVAFGLDERTIADWWARSGRQGQGVHEYLVGRPRLRPWRNVLIAQVVKRYERRRVVDTERRIVDGTPARVETLRRRSQGDGVINTAYIERLNATFRERLAPLARRCRALARQTLTLHEGMFVVGTVYNFCTPHESLHAGQKTTPAMAAGITDHCWTMQELLSFHVPLPRWAPPKQRGRPSRAFQRLIARWCS